MLALHRGPVRILGAALDTNTMLYAGAAVVIGFQAVNFAVFTRIYAIQQGLLPQNRALERLYKVVTLEVGLLVGALVTAAGLAGSVYALRVWATQDFGGLSYPNSLRVVIPSVVAIMIGLQTVFSSFFLSILGLNQKRDPE